MNAEREEEIRARAHAIWEEEGRPEGKSEEHWQRACREIAPDEDTPNKDPKTREAAADDTPKPVTGDGPQSAAEDAPTIADEPAADKPKRATRASKSAESDAKPRANRSKSASASSTGSGTKRV
jgi:Protein of unknown function (DUF2934)